MANNEQMKPPVFSVQICSRFKIEIRAMTLARQLIHLNKVDLPSLREAFLVERNTKSTESGEKGRSVTDRRILTGWEDEWVPTPRAIPGTCSVTL